MKLAQRIALRYYTTKFKAIAAVSPKKAAEAAFTLFCTPYHGKPARTMPALFKHGTPLNYKFGELNIKGFHFTPGGAVKGRLLICHGFDSCCYKFQEYIPLFTAKGFEVFAFDAPGHGLSDGKTINALLYSHLITELDKHFGSFYGIMAHSLGGLALCLAMERKPALSAKKMVLIAPATETPSAIETFLKHIPLTPATEKAFHELIFNIGGQPAAWFSVTRAIQHISAEILWLHDEFDTICSYNETLAAQQLHLPNLQFHITRHLGHSNIYRHEAVQSVITNFFNH